MPNPKPKPLAVAIVTRDAAFYASALAACADVAAGELVIDGELAPPAKEMQTQSIHEEARALARRYLEKSGQAPAITVVQAGSLGAVAEKLIARGADASPLGVLYLDAGSTGLELEAQIEAFYARIPVFVRSPYSVIVHRRTPPWTSGAHVLADRFLERVLVQDTLRTEHLVALVDFLERTFDKPRNHRAALRDPQSTLGDALTCFLGERAGSEWLLFYYTGSSITPLVDHLEHAARARGVLALRAANEHGLACGALANHLLHGRPFLCVIGAAMMDEMRGTLANLRGADAKGFIVCPEADLGSWFGFQSTITADEDIREVLAARRIAHVHLDRVETMPERLEEAYRLYEQARGPVVLLAAPAVIEAREPLPRALVHPEKPAAATIDASQEEALAKALSLINHERTNVVWQLGRLDDESANLVYDIAERAGIALVDTLSHPHPSHRAGRPVRNYLGTLGLYGFNQRAHAFLHEPSGKLRPRAEQAIFFLASKVGGRATNFTPARRSGLRMIQITNRADHVAPDVELAIVMSTHDFLRRVRAGLAVDPDVLRHREAAIAAAAPAPPDIAGRLPSLPMSPSYFFRELGALFTRLIEDDGYAYTGVYDVGRCSVSAARSVPRTGRGFSGWHGRALMGDAPAALPALAVTEPHDVVAFIGDGGKSIVADPLPALLDNALAYPERFDKNVTIFYFSNGTYSGIRTYRERLASRWGGRQLRTIDLIAPDGERRFGPLFVVHRALTTFDGASLREALLARGRLNVFTVLLGHDADDDGFSFVTASWQRGGAGAP